jgi:hypothetical protein
MPTPTEEILDPSDEELVETLRCINSLARLREIMGGRLGSSDPTVALLVAVIFRLERDYQTDSSEAQRDEIRRLVASEKRHEITSLLNSL